ncbi:membrane protein [Streptococcus dysgalactiae subsp. dysgalactiae]|uniref:Membrane protein n=1 Tax=Streptococcus dysgalactiae subsp. dysgalactiae TaxID=99822 RepID=A0A380JTZ9_STRDY|nr:membrane protein [Streptococcus dysgalactiae subsp. dysgalactiae]
MRQLDILNNPNALAYTVKDHVVIGSIGFFTLKIIQVVIPIIPDGVTTVVGFLAFGPGLGFLLKVAGICIGSSLLFKTEEQLDYYERKLLSKTFEVFFVLNMLSPLVPVDALIMITGLSRMSYRKFLIIILICIPISIITFSYFGIYCGEVIRRLLMTS